MNWKIAAILITTLIIFTFAPGCKKSSTPADPMSGEKIAKPTATITSTQTVTGYVSPVPTKQNTPLP